MIEVDSVVKTSPDSDRTFTVIDIEDDARALIAPLGESAAGSYPYWWPLHLLHLVDD